MQMLFFGIQIEAVVQTAKTFKQVWVHSVTTVV